MTVPLTISNSGTISAAGAISIEFMASPDGTVDNGALLATVSNVSINLKAGASKVFKETLIVPPSPPAGDYYLLALIDPKDTFDDSNTANNLVVSTGKMTVH